MLEYDPNKRATAQEMLNSEWFNMPANFDYKMNDREYEKMKMTKEKSKIEKKPNYEKDVIDSDEDLNEGDDEDNSSHIEEEDDDDESAFGKAVDNIEIQNFNNSFAIYGQHVKLSALDKANPQFK